MHAMPLTRGMALPLFTLPLTVMDNVLAGTGSWLTTQKAPNEAECRRWMKPGPWWPKLRCCPWTLSWTFTEESSLFFGCCYCCFVFAYIADAGSSSNLIHRSRLHKFPILWTVVAELSLSGNTTPALFIFQNGGQMLLFVGKSYEDPLDEIKESYWLFMSLYTKSKHLLCPLSSRWLALSKWLAPNKYLLNWVMTQPLSDFLDCAPSFLTLYYGTSIKSIYRSVPVRYSCNMNTVSLHSPFRQIWKVPAPWVDVHSPFHHPFTFS